MSRLIHKTELSPGVIVGDVLKVMMELIVCDENTFTRKAEYQSFKEMSTGLIELAKHDIRILQKVLYVSLEEIA